MTEKRIDFELVTKLPNYENINLFLTWRRATQYADKYIKEAVMITKHVDFKLLAKFHE